MSIGSAFADTVLSGPLLMALPVAALAGLVSFASPCVLPLVPGYLGYVTGLSGQDLQTQPRRRVVTGTVLFVLGFTAVFVALGAAFAAVLGLTLQQGSAGRGALLTVASCLGLGLRFVAVAAGLGRGVRTFDLLRRHRLTLARAGGGMLVVVGLLLVTGVWTAWMNALQGSISGGARSASTSRSRSGTPTCTWRATGTGRASPCGTATATWRSPTRCRSSPRTATTPRPAW